MKSEISEFSYGYALTEHLIRWQGTDLVGAPIFPNLYQEGQEGAGFDVRLNRPSIPLFLQFKLSDYITRRNAIEFQNGSPLTSLDVPFYRLRLRPTYYSQQHPLLLSLEALGNDVFYAAPAFHRQGQLNNAYLTPGRVVERSVFFSPASIGELPDNWRHHIAFDPQQDPDFGYLFSEPKKIRILKPGSFTKHLERKLSADNAPYLSDDALGSLKSVAMEMIGEEANVALRHLEDFRNPLTREPQYISPGALRSLRDLSYLARIFFDSQLFVVQTKSKP